jgi:hypothetical protein
MRIARHAERTRPNDGVLPYHARMQAARTLTLLIAALLALADTACATIIRSSHAELVLRNAPDNLQATDDNGTQLSLHKQTDGTTTAAIGWHTRALTLSSGDASTKVQLETSTSVGYVVVDLVLYVFPLVVDLVSSKWTNFDQVDVATALRRARVATTQRELPLPDIAEPPKKKRTQALLIEPAQTPLIQPAPQQERRQPIIANGKLAVLDFKSYTDVLKPEDVRYFTDLVRGTMLKASPTLQVMTRENLLVLLQATGRDAATCEGECEVDTGRRIGADSVVSGEILKVGSHFKLSLKLHETHDGRLLSTAVASGKSIDELDESAQSAAAELILPSR